MYSLVMLAAMTAEPDVPQHWACPVTPSNYGSGLWSKRDFQDCCAPAQYGWVHCWNKGVGAYPGGCGRTCGSFYRAPACGPCGVAAGCGHGGGHSWCGYDWPIGNQPAYYTSALGCPPHVTAPPYAYYTEKDPCCRYGHFAFDTGLIGHSAGVGYSGFGGYGNFGFYGAVPMMHRPTTADLPPFPRPEYRQPPAVPTGPTPMPPIPMGSTPPATPPGSPAIPLPDDVKKDLPKKKDEPKKGEPKKEKERMQGERPVPATVVLSVPVRATVTVEGHALQSGGSERTFRTPTLAPGQSYTYTVKATLVLAGREENETLQVTVTPGEVSRASFEKLFTKVEGAAARSVAGANR